VQIVMNTTIAWNEPAANDTTNVGDDCVKPVQRDFIPWDNPDNIITKRVYKTGTGGCVVPWYRCHSKMV